MQQCLVRELLLAAVLSTVPVTISAFQKAIWKQSISHRTQGVLDSEMYEHICFAAIQLASHGAEDFGQHNILQFVNQVQAYMCRDKKDESYDKTFLKKLRTSEKHMNKEQGKKPYSGLMTPKK